MKLHIATIRHDAGADGFADTTRDGLLQQLAEYCREYWSELERENEPPTDVWATINEYFANHPVETCDVAEAELNLPN